MRIEDMKNWTVDQLDKRFAKEDLLFGGDE